MRLKQKLVERLALSVFATALEARGIPPIHAPEITDAPDAVFLIDDQAIAIECRYLSHPKLLRLLGPNDWPADRVYEVFLPREPHLWVRDAILEKEPKIPFYKKRSGATQAWLLLHSSSRQRILRSDRSVDSQYFELLCLGAHIAPHSFDQIWIVELSADHRLAVPIYGPGIKTPDISFDRYREQYPSYPIDHFWFSNAMVKESEDLEGQKVVRINLNDLVVEPLCLQPLDSRFVIDYSEILANPNRNANLKDLQWAFYDTPPTF